MSFAHTREVVEIEPEVIIAARLLETLHDEGTRMTSSANPLIANWGRHLLEDWRSLELLAERQRP